MISSACVAICLLSASICIWSLGPAAFASILFVILKFLEVEQVAGILTSWTDCLSPFMVSFAVMLVGLISAAVGKLFACFNL